MKNMNNINNFNCSSQRGSLTNLLKEKAIG